MLIHSMGHFYLQIFRRAIFCWMLLLTPAISYTNLSRIATEKKLAKFCLSCLVFCWTSASSLLLMSPANLHGWTLGKRTICECSKQLISWHVAVKTWIMQSVCSVEDNWLNVVWAHFSKLSATVNWYTKQTGTAEHVYQMKLRCTMNEWMKL